MSSTLMLLMMLHIAVAFAYGSIFVYYACFRNHANRSKVAGNRAQTLL